MFPAGRVRRGAAVAGAGQVGAGDGRERSGVRAGPRGPRGTGGLGSRGEGRLGRPAGPGAVRGLCRAPLAVEAPGAARLIVKYGVSHQEAALVMKWEKKTNPTPKYFFFFSCLLPVLFFLWKFMVNQLLSAWVSSTPENL